MSQKVRVSEVLWNGRKVPVEEVKRIASVLGVEDVREKSGAECLYEIKRWVKRECEDLLLTDKPARRVPCARNYRGYY